MVICLRSMAAMMMIIVMILINKIYNDNKIKNEPKKNLDNIYG